MPDNAREIENLVYAYAERIDAGDLAGVAALFRDGRIQAAPGVVLEGVDAVRRLYDGATRLYDDGTPRTRHVTTNVTIEVDEAAGTATARSYYTVFQQTDALPLQPIIAGHYHDSFHRVDGRWAFDTREMFVDLTGDLSHHLLFELPVTRFRGKVALVSGAASGIGAAVVDRFVEEGAAVVPCDITPIDGGVACDVRDADACRAAVEEALERHGRLDVLANVAGVAVGNRIEDVTPDEWRRVVDVNLTGTFLLSQAALPALLETTGTIVNMASVAGIQATPYNAAYCASKGGVIMLTKSMALELAKAGVRVNAVCPASVDTPFLHGFELPDDADLQLLMRSVSPMGRLIDPAEVAAAVAYLASGDAATVSGTTLVIDGAASA